MGVASPREKIEAQMLKLKYRRVEINEERLERIKQLEDLTGREVKRPSIPDYIDLDDNKKKNNSSIQTSSRQSKNNSIKTRSNKIKKDNKKKDLKDDKNKKLEKESNFEKKLKKGNNGKKNNKDKKHYHYQVTKD